MQSIQFNGFSVVPENARTLGLAPRVGEIFENFGLPKKFRSYKIIELEIKEEIPPNTPLKEAYSSWLKPEFLEKDSSQVRSMPHQPMEALTPEPLIAVHISCINRRSGGMSSWYGFEGLFLFALVSLTTGEIWNARQAKTD